MTTTGNDTLGGAVIDAATVTGSDADGFAGTEPDLALGFDGIETLIGNGGTFTGASVNSTWLLDGTPTYDDGAHTLNISGFATLQGGAAEDQFSITAASPFDLLGGDDADTFSFGNAGSLAGAVDGPSS